MDNLKLLLGRRRTFACAIPLLPEPVRHEVTVAHRLLRVADALEGVEHWGQAHRISALAAFSRLLRSRGEQDEVVIEDYWWIEPAYLREGCRDLLGELPRLMLALRALAPSSRA